MLNKSPKRIVIIGSAGVGKTTLLNNLKKKIDLKTIPETAREICNQSGYKSIYEIKDPDKFRFLVLNEQIKFEEKYKEFLSDRSTIDCWVHWVRWSWNIKRTFESENYFKLAYAQALKYSDIIYIPRMFKSKDDGFRWSDEDYQRQVDRLFREILLEWELTKRTFIVESKNLKDRVKEVMKYLKSY